MAIARFDPPNGGGDLPEYRPIAEINITPLVDVMLVVLVVFMVAAPLMVAGVRVDLPHTATTRLSETKKPMVVTLARDGSVYVRDQKTDLADLADRLAALRRQEGDTTVYLRADRGIVYGDVMELLGRITAVGYERVSLLAQPPRRSDSARIR